MIIALYIVVGLVLYLTALMEDRVRALNNKNILITMEPDTTIGSVLSLGIFIGLIYAIFWPGITLGWIVYKLVIIVQKGR